MSDRPHLALFLPFRDRVQPLEELRLEHPQRRRSRLPRALQLAQMLMRQEQAFFRRFDLRPCRHRLCLHFQQSSLKSLGAFVGSRYAADLTSADGDGFDAVEKVW